MDAWAEVNPPDYMREASSSLEAERPGTAPHRGMLDSPLAWSAKVNDGNQWYDLTLDKPREVAGVVLQGREDNLSQFLKSFRLSCFKGKNKQELGPFEGFQSQPKKGERKSIIFATPVSCERLRLHPVEWNRHISLRLGVLIRKDKCCWRWSSQQLISEYAALRHDAETLRTLLAGRELGGQAEQRLKDLVVEHEELCERHGQATARLGEVRRRREELEGRGQAAGGARDAAIAELVVTQQELQRLQIERFGRVADYEKRLEGAKWGEEIKQLREGLQLAETQEGVLRSSLERLEGEHEELRLEHKKLQLQVTEMEAAKKKKKGKKKR